MARKLSIYCKNGHLMSETRVVNNAGHSYCSICRSESYKNYRQKDIINLRKLDRERKILKHYKLTPEEYNALLTKQNNKCAICGNEFTPKSNYTKSCVDHNHHTGIVRGLICGKCNIGIGNLCDDISIVKSALKYLEYHNPNGKYTEISTAAE